MEVWTVVRPTAEATSTAGYAFHVDVETTDSIPQYTDEIRDIITSGIAIHGTEQFEKVKSILEIPADTES